MPWFSAFTAFTEVLVTVAVFYVLYAAVFRGEFKGRVLGVALAYEVLFNISYMTWRLFTHVEPAGSQHAAWMVALVAGHGALSLVMFLALVGMSIAAYRWHKRGENLFGEHRAWTATFAALWMVSILSGETIFVLEYVYHA